MRDPYDRLADDVGEAPWSSPLYGGMSPEAARLSWEASQKKKRNGHATGEIVRLDTGARLNTEQPAPLIKSSREFVSGFIPPDYLVDGLLQEAFLYSLTGATGAGKTAITLRLAASLAVGAPFANRETKKRPSCTWPPRIPLMFGCGGLL